MQFMWDEIMPFSCRNINIIIMSEADALDMRARRAMSYRSYVSRVLADEAKAEQWRAKRRESDRQYRAKMKHIKEEARKAAAASAVEKL